MHRAEVAELVDALASGASGGDPVEVQVLSSAPSRQGITIPSPKSADFHASGIPSSICLSARLVWSCSGVGLRSARYLCVSTP